MRIGVDVMGGDHAPDEILKGCVAALDLIDAGDTIVLIGDEAAVREHLAERGIADERLEVVHAPDTIGMDESPALAVRSKVDSSIVKMAILGSHKADKAGAERCDVVLSAGNTGACVAAGIMHMKRLPGVHRPGIAVTVPAFHGPVVLCDAGANPQPTGKHLWQYGVMSDVYAREVLGIANPRVAIMNIGSEEAKGSDLVKQARDLMKATPDLNFIGYVEGRDFFAGHADVIITDGFTGNTILKMAEGMAKSLFQAIAEEIVQTDPELALQFEPVVKSIFKKNDYHEYGGAPLLGVNGSMMIAHGSSVAKSIRAAIRASREMVSHHVNDHILERLGQLDALEAATGTA